MSRWKLLAAVVAFAPMIGALRAQDEPKADGQQRMPEFQPGKEHQLLKQFDGDWEFKAKCTMPGMEPSEGQGTESARLTHGGFWLTCDEKGMMKDKDFSGQGFIGYNPAAKKYVGVWVDNHSPFMGKFIGDADTSGKVFTFRFMMTEKEMAARSAAREADKKDAGKEYDKESRKDMGKEMKVPDRMVHEIKDQDHRTLKFYGKDDSGKESLWTEITYTRKPAMVK